MKKIPIGISDFKELIETDNYFVDKSLFIKEIINEDAKVVLLPRPRRFGKTLNLSMLRYFFEKTEQEQETKGLFKGLDIEQTSEFEEHCNKYPLIFLTLKEIKDISYENAISSLNQIISKEYSRHKYLLKSTTLDEIEKQRFQRILEDKAEPVEYRTSLKELSFLLCRHFDKKAIILIDEYDTPIHTAYVNGYYNEMTSFMRAFLGDGLKDNSFLQKGVITGILRVAKESIFSDLNNLGVYTLLSTRYSDKFGFTEMEVKGFLNYLKIENHFEKIKHWYNGYLFSGHQIYNPWSILNYASSHQDGFKAYWANTSSHEMLRNMLKDSTTGIKTELHDLLKGIPVVKRIDENIVIRDIINDDITIYSFLLFSGYLKASLKEYIEDEPYYNLHIPNEEIKLIFRNIILKWFNESYSSEQLQKMLKALTNGEVKIFERILNDFVLQTLSYFDTQRQNVERVYQAFILGLLVNLSANYEINSEKESGYGRYDIAVLPKDNSKIAILMELKKIDELNEETKDEALESALQQIAEKKYDADLIKRGYTKILKMAVTFDGKRVWIKENKPQ